MAGMAQNIVTLIENSIYGKFEESVHIKPGGTWNSRHQKRTSDHYDPTVTDSKGHKSWLKKEGCKINHLLFMYINVINSQP